MKKRLLFFLFIQIQMMAIYAQEEYIYQNVQVLTVKNQQFCYMIDDIVDFESKYMDDSISDARSYLIDYELWYDDTTIIVTSIYSIHTDNILLSSMYGVFVHHSRLIFVKNRIGENFIPTENVMSVKTWGSPDLLHFVVEDSETRWTFLLNRGYLTLRSREGFSFQEKYREKYMQKIDIIEDKVDDFPIQSPVKN